MATDSDVSPEQTAYPPVIRLRDAELRFGQRVLWHDLDLDVSPGEFVAVLGPNGTGKTSLLKVLLGQHSLSTGSAQVGGRSVHAGNSAIGYIPQQRGIDQHTPMRGRDLVRMGIDGHRWGTGRFLKRRRQQVDELLASVGARDYADAPAGTLSGGELQRLRVAQALANDPSVLLCDEPLLSLDIHHQKVVASLLHEQRVERNTAVLFVTHEINPILPYVDRVLYIVGGHFLVGTPAEVMTTESLSRLYGSPVEVVRVAGRLIVVGGEAECFDHHVHEDDMSMDRGAI
ncbi:MAG: metal ABC transporter ATP-binding protein [Brevibacterium sp.]|uniref:metal ABC transporter ATP-binding protein n=1 Tax=Brevibacterium sp. TaxID=1701 RepID=UPI00264A100F|nr:metal ABC transporter ATP-binding protein [Brevibacterium sp.]MDN5806851.1 metal ABC transporter ATP-binding protein [Brevibacterium sp.]MDN5832928.1 metal ABC transporter ATP-binding protein [Brevibacterium sp.]MDN5875589.1 metal ABC transporter ATP-binding protein [Brevibacterium sp.]MDN5909319.1 metal ABC transporter ATP-binding protein [Brevibacterium sp.]MDN6133272.1 metal ABC transporter ATP-binding protein [Brevibacterium sp.]